MRYAFDDFVLDDVDFLLEGPDGPVAIEPQVFDLLAHLVARADRLVTKEELLDEIWGDRFVSESALTSRLKLARRAVGDDGRAQRVIQTAHGRGYRFVAEVVALDSPPATPMTIVTAEQPAQAGVPPGLRLDEDRRFVGRVDELQQAVAMLDDPGGHGARSLWILGEPGIGKTTLAAEIARRAHSQGAALLYGRCDEDLPVPYQPFVDALRAFASTIDDEHLLVSLGPLPAELLRLVPRLAGRLPGIDSAATADAATEQYRFFEAVAGWLERVAGGGYLLFVLDDAHWAGPGTVQLLRHLLRSPDAGRVLLVITSRDTAPDTNPQLDRLLDARGREQGDRVLTLGGLDAAEVGRLVGDLESNDRIHAETGGNPLLVEALVEGNGEGGDVAAAVQRRLSSLAEPVRDTLHLAAVVGLDIDVPVLAGAASRPELEILDDLETAAAARLVSAVDVDTYRFEHAIVRASLLDGLSAARRSRWHEAVADAIESGPSTNVEDRAAALVFHLTRAPDTPDVRRRILAHAPAAARRAAELFDFDEALAYLDQSLDLVEPDDHRQRAVVLLVAGEIETRAGRHVPAMASYENAFAAAARGGADDLMIEAAVEYEDVSWRPGFHGDAALAKLMAVEPLVDDDLVTQVRVQSAIGRALAYTGRHGDAAERLEDAEALARTADDPQPVMRVMAARINADLPDDDAAAGLAYARDLKLLAGAADDLDAELNARQIELRQLARLGWIDEFTTGLESFITEAEATRSPFWRYAVRNNEAMAAFFTGDLDEAERLSDACLELTAELPGEDNSGMHGLRMFLIRREQDRLRPLLPLLSSLEDDDSAAPIWRPGLAALFAGAGELHRAADLLGDLAADGFTDVPRDAMWNTVMAFLIDVSTAIGDRPRAEMLHEVAQPMAEGMVITGHGIVNLGAGTRYLAMTALTLGRWEEAEALVNDAIDHNEAAGSSLWAGHARYTKAALHAARGETVAAVELATEVDASAREHGFTALARMAADLIRRDGAVT